MSNWRIALGTADNSCVLCSRVQNEGSVYVAPCGHGWCRECFRGGVNRSCIVCNTLLDGSAPRTIVRRVGRDYYSLPDSLAVSPIQSLSPGETVTMLSSNLQPKMDEYVQLWQHVTRRSQAV